MPELPEVETIRRMCETHLAGHAVVGFTISLPKLLRQSALANPECVVGRTLLSAGRYGKVLDLVFSDGIHLLIHFKLSGQWSIVLPDGDRFVAGHPIPRPDGELPHKSTHASIMFDDGRRVWYSDIRQFGWFSVVPADTVEQSIGRLNLGPEATEPIDLYRLQALIAKRSVTIKSVLLDQTVLAGLGNIYVDEVLFAAGIHPARAAKSLTKTEVDQIAEAISPVLAEGIRQGGATIIHSKAIPENGFPAVHGREGERCNQCESEIIKIRVAARGTYVCPQCQPNQ